MVVGGYGAGVDDLRTRILLALIDSTPSEYLPPPNDMSAQVDAVIAALGLTRVTRSQNPPIHRYVTEWNFT